MTDLIERVARAICEANEARVAGRKISPDAIQGAGPREFIGKPYWMRYSDMARAAIEVMGGWQPIATAPKDGTPILWYVDRGECAYRRHGYEVVSWPRDKQCFEVGKWMPLPPPPEGEK